MSTTPSSMSSPTVVRRTWLSACRTRWSQLTPLAREVILILLAKAIVLTVIWFAFFSQPAPPRMSMEPQRVESRLLAPRAAMVATDAVR